VEVGPLVGVPPDERRVFGVDVHVCPASRLDLPGQPGVVVVPVGQKDPVDILDGHPAVGERRFQLRPRRFRPVAGVDEGRLGSVVEEVGVVVPLERGVRQRDAFHAPN
jgi:hypothetical protein